MALLIFSTLAIFILAEFTNAINVNSSPSKIPLGQPGQLTINCTTLDWSTNERVVLKSLTLSSAFIGQARDFQDLVTYSVDSDGEFELSPISRDINAVAEGHIDPRGESYLSLTFPRPNSEDARVYRCVAQGEYTNGDLITRQDIVETEINGDFLVRSVGELQNAVHELLEISDETQDSIKELETANQGISDEVKQVSSAASAAQSGLAALTESVEALRASSVSKESLESSLANVNNVVQLLESVQVNAKINTEQRLASLEASFASLQASLGDLGRSHDALKARFTRAAAQLFDVSAPYNGRRYYLARKIVDATIHTAQATCEVYGGYLAEVNNATEFQFVQEFLKTTTVLTGVFISGTDAAKEGQWVWPRLQQPVGFIDWAPGQPDNWGTYANCLILWRDKNWKMDDTDCYLQNGLTRFLCEIPE
ncbi:unnamed protein product [Lymnaea stagnalis]|uniref:C-type lectin domain-containing protein n=1 Tax=Lymnaea stagnalis TaxID=6523 RepID=A0AAV2H4S7_LYMST